MSPTAQGGIESGADSSRWTLADLESEAPETLNARIRAYVQGGAGREATLRANRAAFRRWALRPRALLDVSAIDLRVSILGRPTAAPFFAAPTAYHREVHPDGEAGTARALAEANVLGVFSTLSSASLEEIAAASDRGPRWFQLYLQPEFRSSQRLVERAERAGYSAIVLTVDAPVLGVRDRHTSGGFVLDGSVPLGNGPGLVVPSLAPEPVGGVYRLPPPADQTWTVLDDLGSITRLPIVVKGILTAEDARQSVRHGARGVVVSNHGGRQLDGARAALEALPEVVREVGSETEVYLDGGVRRGPDVVVALALGARAVGLGRPFLWALSRGGTLGVGRFLDLLGTDLATTLALVGQPRAAAVDETLLVPVAGAATPE